MGRGPDPRERQVQRQVAPHPVPSWTPLGPPGGRTRPNQQGVQEGPQASKRGSFWGCRGAGFVEYGDLDPPKSPRLRGCRGGLSTQTQDALERKTLISDRGRF